MHDLMDTKDPVLAALDLKARRAYDLAWKQYAQAVRFPLETSDAQRAELYAVASKFERELSVEACKEQAKIAAALESKPKKLKKVA